MRDAAEHGRNLERVYGPQTWTLYEQLDESLNPRGPDWLRGLAAGLLSPGASVLDAGCRDAAQLIQLARDHPTITGVGVEPVPLHVQAARDAVAGAGLSDRITVIEGEIATVARQGSTFDLVWCRDVLEQVADLSGAVVDLARLTRPDGSLVIFTTVTTETLAPGEAALLTQHLGNVPENLSRSAVESAFATAGLRTVAAHEIGTEWREWSEERTQPVSRALLRLARLRRDRARHVAVHGAEIVDHVEANLHWEAFHFLGKLLPIVYVLRPADSRH
jgi:2-polyprenyl-3-methyl-5-hydroxy-6-metoxy-1,4-benzoquinol methylase